jgi:hypothetical protein
VPFEPWAEADPDEPALAVPPVAVEPLELWVEADPEPDELAFALPLIAEDALEPWAEPEPDELALALPPLAEELFEVEADPVPEPEPLALALPLVPVEAVEPCAEPDPDELVFELPPVAEESFEVEVEADPEPEPEPLAFALPLVPEEALEPWAEPELDEPAFAVPLVPDEAPEPWAEPELDEPAFAVPLVPDEAPEPWAEPELDELVVGVPLVPVDALDPGVEVAAEPELPVFVVPFAAEVALEPCAPVDAAPDELAFDPLPAVDDEFDVLPLDWGADWLWPAFACHQFPLVELAELPEFCDVDGVPVDVSEVGLVFADVFDALCVLAVPPLTLGWTVIEGWIVIVGCTLMTAAAIALALFLPWDRWPGVIPVGVTARAWLAGLAVWTGTTRTWAARWSGTWCRAESRTRPSRSSRVAPNSTRRRVVVLRLPVLTASWIDMAPPGQNVQRFAWSRTLLPATSTALRTDVRLVAIGNQPPSLEKNLDSRLTVVLTAQPGQEASTAKQLRVSTFRPRPRSADRMSSNIHVARSHPIRTLVQPHHDQLRRECAKNSDFSPRDHECMNNGFSGLVQNGVRHRCAKHPSGRSGNGPRPPFVPGRFWV